MQRTGQAMPLYSVFFLIAFLFGSSTFGDAASCAELIKPTNEIAGCEWKETQDTNKCPTYTLKCKEDAKIDRGCLLDSDNGPCFAHMTRYFYNARVGKCVPFVFGGCSGNANNFESMADCTDVCIGGKPRKTPSVSLAANSDSDSINCINPNEQAYKCGACDSYCDKPAQVCTLLCRPAECGCIDGYVRNAKDVCVAANECKNEPKFLATGSNSIGAVNGGKKAEETKGSFPSGSELAAGNENVKTIVSVTPSTTAAPTTRPTSTSTASTTTTSTTTIRSTQTSTTTTTTPRPTTTSTLRTTPTTPPTTTTVRTTQTSTTPSTTHPTSTTTRPTLTTSRPTSTTSRPTSTSTQTTTTTRPSTTRSTVFSTTTTPFRLASILTPPTPRTNSSSYGALPVQVHPAPATMVGTGPVGADASCAAVSCVSGSKCENGRCVPLSKPSVPLCDRIRCPTDYKCRNGSCIPPRDSDCPRLRLALPPNNCNHEYREDESGCPQPYIQCDGIDCGENEEAKLCGACDGTCGSPVCIPAQRCLKPSCGCVTGYVRDHNSRCVPKKECDGLKKTTDKKPMTTRKSTTAFSTTAKPFAPVRNYFVGGS